MTINRAGNHPAPTPLRAAEYTLFFIPPPMLASVEGFFSGLEEPEEYFTLVAAMRVEQLSWQPERIARADVRELIDPGAGVWVAVAQTRQAARLRTILGLPPPGDGDG